MIGSLALLTVGWVDGWTGRNSISPLCWPGHQSADADTKRHRQCTMAELISQIFWLHFCTLGGSGDTSPIFLFVSGVRTAVRCAHSNTVNFRSSCFTFLVSLYLFPMGTVHINEHVHVNMADCSLRPIYICCSVFSLRSWRGIFQEMAS